MDISDEEPYSSIRQTIRQVILPLVQAIYAEDPSDILLFAAQYFQNLLRKRGNENGGQETGPQLQGSWSEPLLSGPAGRSLRETSSWDGPPKGGAPSPDRADIVSRIGDQGDDVQVPSEDTAQTDAKSGDANVAPKDEEEIFESGTPQEHKTAAMPVLPSAPPYEENRGDAQSEFENSQEIPTSMSSKEYPIVGEDGNKTLSPNSSFGFIPQLSEENCRRESTELSVDSSLRDKSPEQVQELTVKFSETLQNLAQKFDSAENNLNLEFQKAKEISDIIQGRCQNESIAEDENLVPDLKISNERTAEKKSRETVYGDNFHLVSDKNNNIITTRDGENNCKDDEAEEITSVKDEPDRYNCGLDDSNPSSVKSKDSDRQRNISSHDDECRVVNHFGSQSVVDESWRKRWYEVHPCLDSVDRSFQQTAPRLLRTKRIFTGDRSSLSVHNVGEGGDVPADGHHFPQRYAFHGPGRSNGSTNSDNSSVVTKPASEIKISLKENDKDLTDSALPCTWNKTNQLVDYLETKNHALKQLLETLDERSDDSKIRPDSSEVSCEQETLSEIIVVKESDESVKDDLDINRCTPSDDNQTACGRDNLTKIANEDTELSPTKMARIETNVTEEKILSDSNDRDPNTENYIDAVELHENLSEETTNSDVDCHSKELFDKDRVRKEIPLDRKAEDSETESKDSYQREEEQSKVEPGLNSACGDFTLSRVAANTEGDSQQAGLANSQYRNLSGAGVQAITAEYVEEIMDRLMQQQSLNDSYEGLHFSSYSESESSNVESDFSEADDTSLNNGMREF